MTTITATENAEVRDKATSRPAPTGPCALVIFGITGDLSKRLLLPALYNLARQRLLSDKFAIIGFASSDTDEQGLRNAIAEDLKKALGSEADNAVIEWLASRVRYIAATFDDEAGWKRLLETLPRVETEYRTEGNCLFYLATAPEFFLSLPKRLANEGLMDEGSGHCSNRSGTGGTSTTCRSRWLKR
jgi:glucose-6-phosphate 1-dehydrogenase